LAFALLESSRRFRIEEGEQILVEPILGVSVGVCPARIDLQDGAFDNFLMIASTLRRWHD